MKVLARRWLFVLLLGIFSGCGAADPTPIPTLAPLLSRGPLPSPIPGAIPTPLPLAQATPTSVAQPLPAGTLPTPDQSSADPLAYYRQLIDEARATYPYTASSDEMYQVMLCESGGDPQIQGPGGLVGLFQFLPATWQGEWNPYRQEAITDARAQIFATAKAWSDGYMSWWQVCLP